MEDDQPMGYAWGRMTVQSSNRHVEYWRIRLSAHSLTRTTHSFGCSTLLALLARPAALIRPLAGSLTRSQAKRKEVHGRSRR